jgi:hypothetical protein
LLDWVHIVVNVKVGINDDLLDRYPADPFVKLFVRSALNEVAFIIGSFVGEASLEKQVECSEPRRVPVALNCQVPPVRTVVALNIELLYLSYVVVKHIPAELAEGVGDVISFISPILSAIGLVDFYVHEYLLELECAIVWLADVVVGVEVAQLEGYLHSLG